MKHILTLTFALDDSGADSTIGYTLDQVIAVCIGLHIPPEYSFDLIEKAGFRLRNTPEHLVYKSVLQTMYMEKLATIQRLLVKCGFHELKLKEKFD